MEDDPNKKDSKGKRNLKKAIRRLNSKSSNKSQSSDNSVNISRSKSFENKGISIKKNDSTPLPTPDGTDKDDIIVKSKFTNGVKSHAKRSHSAHSPDIKINKTVNIKEDLNEIFEETTSRDGEDSKHLPNIETDGPSELSAVKKSLKRKLEEESPAGTSGASTGASDTDADDKDPSKDKKKKNRCAVCRKKVGLTGFECRCGGLFCAVHRYSDKHECSFDYRELGAQEIRRNNPVVVSQKIHKI